MLNCNTWNNLTMCKQMSSNTFKKKKYPLTNHNIYICIYIYHHVVSLARISLTLSRHLSLSFIARASGLHPVSSHSCCMYVRAGRPAFAWPYAVVHWNTSLISSSLLLQQCPECLVRQTWIVFVMRGRWPYSWCLVGCCCQVLFNIMIRPASEFYIQKWANSFITSTSLSLNQQYIYIYIYIYIVIHWHTVSLYHNSSVWLDT